MRGKHANAAERRRYLEELEKRASEAERTVEKLTAELSSLKASSERTITSLRQELTATTKQRDEAASPRLAEADEQIRKLRDEVKKLESEKKVIKDDWSRQILRTKGLLELVGLTPHEAMETALGGFRIADDDLGASRASRERLSYDRTMALQKARGYRSDAPQANVEQYFAHLEGITAADLKKSFAERLEEVLRDADTSGQEAS